MKHYFVLKLIPPRPDFAQHMTAEEREVMLRHVEYWKDLMNRGFVLAFGPVLHPEGSYGLAVVEVDDPAQVIDFMAGDPALSICRYEHHPMMAMVPPRK